MPARSWLFVPGDSPEKIEKSSAMGADARIIDLEDAIPAGRKAAAREQVAAWLSQRSDPGEIWIRVNNTPELLDDDLRAVLVEDVAGVVLPKTQDGSQAHEVGEKLARIAAGVGFVPMVETALAVLDAAKIATASGVTTLMVGEYDLAAELGVVLSDFHPELQTARSMVVLACSAAGVESPIGPVSTQFRDEALFLSTTKRLRAEGHFGRAVIHPAQIGPANHVFTPTSVDVSRARDLVEAFELQKESGVGVSVDADGALVDEAIARLANRTLETAKHLEEETQ
ncbi:MAG: CoA ester lyase [Acidimicrobiia bacterium]|nr:CoA ester lyase [Acidimicrobiia bacterium]